MICRVLKVPGEPPRAGAGRADGARGARTLGCGGGVRAPGVRAEATEDRGRARGTPRARDGPGGQGWGGRAYAGLT